MSIDVRIASASYEDLPEVARIHVAAWKQAYVGQVPQSHLDSLDVAQRLQRWREQFPNRVLSGLSIASVKGKAAGFICFGHGREQERQDWGEIYAIYVMKPYWGCGVGYQLHRTASVEFKRNGFAREYLWVLDTNHRAIAAYERWGGMLERDRFKDHEIGGQPVKEVSVVFSL